MAPSSSPNSFNTSSFDTSTTTIHSQNSASASTPTSANSVTSPVPSSLLSPTYSTFQSSISNSTASTASTASTINSTSNSIPNAIPNAIPTAIPVPPSTFSTQSDQFLHNFQKRIQTLIYLKHSTLGNQSWFNTIRLSRRDLDLIFSPELMKKRSSKFMLLGYSISALFDSDGLGSNPPVSSDEFCRSILNILQELDAYMDTGEIPTINTSRKQSGGSSSLSAIGAVGAGGISKNFNFFGSVKGSKGNKKAMGMGMAIGLGMGSNGMTNVNEFGGCGTLNSQGAEDLNPSPTSSNSTMNAASQSSFGNHNHPFGLKEEVHLQIPNVPFQLDFFQTFYTLCDILSEVYHKLISYLGSTPGLITLNQSIFPPSSSSSTSGASSVSGLPLTSNSNSNSTSTLSSLMNHQGSNNSNFNSISSNASASNPYSSNLNSSSHFPSPPNSTNQNLNLQSWNSAGNEGDGVNHHQQQSASGRSSFENQYSAHHNPSIGFAGSVKGAGTGNGGNNQVKVELMSKVDGKLKKIITQMSKELETLARNLIKEELNSLNPLLSEPLPAIQPAPSGTTTSKTGQSLANHSQNQNRNHGHTFSNGSNTNTNINPFSSNPMSNFSLSSPANHLYTNQNHPFVNNLGGMISPTTLNDHTSSNPSVGFPFSGNSSSNPTLPSGLSQNPNLHNIKHDHHHSASTSARKNSNPNIGVEI